VPPAARPTHDDDVELAFLLATLFALDRSAYRLSSESDHDDPTSGSDSAATREAEDERHSDGGAPRRRGFGSALAASRRPGAGEGDSLDRRVAMLLDSTIDRDGSGSLAWRLRHAVRLVLSRHVAIDWVSLYLDLQDWNRVDRRVQRRWAQDYFNLSGTTAGASGDDELQAASSDEGI
jgi:CRISPR type I-E-associated protein CasB/Cse2